MKLAVRTLTIVIDGFAPVALPGETGYPSDRFYTLGGQLLRELKQLGWSVPDSIDPVNDFEEPDVLHIHVKLDREWDAGAELDVAHLFDEVAEAAAKVKGAVNHVQQQ